MIATALLAAGCGSSASRHTRAASPPLDGCVSFGTGVRAVTLHPAGGPSLPGVVIGTGKTTFVLTDESDENLCYWLPLVRPLEAHGYSALLYDYTDPTELPAQVQAGVAAARRAGAGHVVVMGASVGARASVEAAASRPPGVIAAVGLSAERSTANDLADLVAVARRVTLPTLLISARDDPFVAGATRPLLGALHSRRKRALILPGADHGTSLLTDSHGPLVQRTIFAFVGSLD